MESDGYAQIAMTPSQAAYESITWSSSNPDVATVDEYGIIHSHGEGVAEISALVVSDGYEYPTSCTLTVAGQNVHNEAIAVKPDDQVTVFDIKGIQVFTGWYRDWVPRHHGVYVVRYSDKVTTVIR